MALPGLRSRYDRVWALLHIWAASGRSPNDGMLCLNCLQRRLGRKPKFEDFTAVVPRAAGVASGSAGCESGSVVARRPVALAIRRRLILSPPAQSHPLSPPAQSHPISRCGLLQHGEERLGFGVMVAKGGVQCLTSQRQPFRIVLVGFDGPCLERLDCSAVLGCHSHGQSSDPRRLSISKSLFSIWVRV
jgi:hypothetical protein